VRACWEHVVWPSVVFAGYDPLSLASSRQSPWESSYSYFLHDGLCRLDIFNSAVVQEYEMNGREGEEIGCRNVESGERFLNRFGPKNE